MKKGPKRVSRFGPDFFWLPVLFDLEAISHILLDTLEIVAPSVEAEESDAE